MKKTILLITVVALGFIIQSFNYLFPPNSFKFYELSNGETINFQSRPEFKKNSHAGWYSRGSYDLSKYKMNIDTQGNLKVSELRGCPGKHQGEISLFHSKGSLTRIGDTLKIQANTIYDKFYIFGIKENGIVDSLSSDINIDLVSRTLKGNYCPNLIRIQSEVTICALPEKINIKEVYKSLHKENTVGEFVYFTIRDSENKVKIFPHGDYVIIGADNVTIVK